MPKRKSVQKYSERRKPGHYNAILIEDLKSEFKFVIETVQDVEGRITRRMDEKFTRVDERFEVVETVLRQHSKELREIKTTVDEHSRDLREIKATLDKVVDKVEHHGHDVEEIKRVAS